MSPPKKDGDGKRKRAPKRKPAAKPKPRAEQDPEKTQRLDETQEFALGDDFLSDLDAADAGGETAEHPAPEPPDDEPAAQEKPEPEPEEELEELINAETQEWDGIDPDAEDEDFYDEEEELAEEAHPTMVAQARDKVTSGFEAVGGGKVTSGFKAVGRHIRFPMWARFATASLLIVCSIGAATAASLLLYIEDIANALDPDEEFAGITDRLPEVEGGEPQTIMILGSDKRPELKGDGFRGLSDTTMLLRVDPDKNALALFSLPRDLRVSIPGYGTDKLNAAYAYGGPELTLRTVQELTKVPATNMQGLDIHHVVNIDFEGFARAVNAIECVYVDVDRRYFNKNDDFDGEEDYEEIDLQPGYQALCGFDALDYARYRHTDNDVVRAARQQDFLREARQKVPPEVLFADRKELITIFTEHTTSDINSADAMLQVLKLFIEARDAPLKQVKFEGTLGPSFVETTPDEIDRAVEQFLGLEDSPGARASSSAPENPEAVGTPDVAPDQAPVQKPKAKAKPEKAPDDEPASVTETTFGKELAKGIRSRKVKLPIYYPTVLEVGSDFPQKPRVYKINGTGDDAPPNSERAAYKWVFSRPALGEYYGFMATRWKDPPALKNPSAEKEIGGRTYKLYYDGDRLRMIAWQTDEGSFWVSNTLAQSLTDQELLDVAKGMTELPKPGD
jgi:LCP family protein required for cell wall assembly